LASAKTEVVIGSFGAADLMQLPVRNPIEVDIMGKNEPYVLSAVVPERANAGSETQFSTDNQPKNVAAPVARATKCRVP
jgi:hypothetical protein